MIIYYLKLKLKIFIIIHIVSYFHYHFLELMEDLEVVNGGVIEINVEWRQ